MGDRRRELVDATNGVYRYDQLIVLRTTQMPAVLLEEKVVELHIVERASDNTIGRTLKKTFSNRIANSNG
jgi:hypothetical protein